MPKNLSAKNYQENKERLQKKRVKDTKNYSKNLLLVYNNFLLLLYTQKHS